MMEVSFAIIFSYFTVIKNEDVWEPCAAFFSGWELLD